MAAEGSPDATWSARHDDDPKPIADAGRARRSLALGLAMFRGYAFLFDQEARRPWRFPVVARDR